MKFLSIFKSKIFYFVLLVIIGSGTYAVFGRDTTPKFETKVVTNETITQIISETGKVQPAEDINLSFARSGRISQVLVGQGDRITKGQVLAVLESSSLSAELRQAQIALEREKILLEDLYSKATPEDLALTENSRTLAQTTFNNAQKALQTAIANAYVSADDAVQSKADQLFSNPKSSSPDFGVKISQGSTTLNISAPAQQRLKINSLRVKTEQQLKDLANLLQDGQLVVVEDLSNQSEQTLGTVQNLLTEISVAINGYVADDTTTQLVYDGYKFDISTARTAVNNAISSVSTASQAYASAKTALNTPQVELDFKNAGPTENTIRLQELRILEASSRVDSVVAQINDAKIVSPLDGVVTKKFLSRGEVTGNSPVLSVISNEELEISVFISEDDIEFINIDDKARITFDAYGDLELLAQVVFISNSAEIIEGIAVFEVKLLFDQIDDRVKSGLSVDVDIISKEVNNVLAVPTRAVVEEGTVRYVRVIISDFDYSKRAVELGLRGDNGSVEVTKGLNPGDTVITFITEDDLKKLTEH